MDSESYRWHYDYTRLAWESGFTFDSNKSRKTFDRNKIALLDIDRIIRERDIAIVEKHLDNILDFNLDYDELKILDQSFVKLFKLYQLSVEFLMYCKKYLDKTIVLVKTDLEKKIEETDFLQKEYGRVLSENNKLKRKVKDLKMTLHYHHQLQTNLKDQVTIYQCNECGKTFINNEYLNSHLKRRHNLNEEKILDDEKISQDESLHTSLNHEQYKTEADRLQSEIKELKEKLNNTERYFNSEERINSPDHHKNPNEFYNEIKTLQQQFDILKNTVVSELELLKTQKIDHEKYDSLVDEVLNENVTNKNDFEEVRVTEYVNSFTQTEDIMDLKESNLNSPIMVVRQRKLSIQKNEERPSSFIKVVESSEKNGVDIQLVQEEVERKLEEKTKKEIEQLGEQLTNKMSTNFNMLEEKMQLFWDKINEKPTIISQIPSQVLKENETSTKSNSDSEIMPYQKHNTKTIEKNIKISDSESDSLSETESNIQISPIPTPRKENTQKLIEELKNKIEEKNKVNVKKIDSKVIPTSKKGEILNEIQKPMVKKVISQPIKNTTTESETESSTETDSESSEEEKKVEIKPKIIKDVKIKEPAIIKRPKSKILTRDEILQEVNKRLKQLGIGPDIKISKQRTSEIILQQKNLKKSPTYTKVRRNILEQIESRFNANQKTLPDKEEQPSKFKSIVSSMKSKAMLLMKTPEKTNISAPIYKLTVHQEIPQEEKVIPKKVEKEKTVVKREKIIIKPKKNYISDSDSVKSDDEYIKNKKAQVKNSPRKSISVTSLNTSSEKTKSLQNIEQSISNIDSILELKKEILSEIKNDNVLKDISSDDSTNFKEKMDQRFAQGDIDHKKDTKSVLKNYPSTSSLVKKKVIFDLESESKSEPKKIIKNSFFDFEKDDDSTSVTSSIFDGNKTNINQSPKEKISTEAQINVSAQKVKKNDYESDFDISDLL